MSDEIKTAGTVTDVNVPPLKDDSAPSIVVTFKRDDTGSEIQKALYCSFAAMERTAKDLATLGWDIEANDYQVDAMIEAKTLIGKRVALVLAEEEYKGKLTLKVKWINSLGMPKGTIHDARSLSEKLRAQFKKTTTTQTDGIPF